MYLYSLWLLYLTSLIFQFAGGAGLDCCSAEYSYSGLGCTSSGTVYEGVRFLVRISSMLSHISLYVLQTTTYCVTRNPKCTTCLVSTEVEESECSKCCSPTAVSCKDSLSTDISYSGWGMNYFVLHH